MNKAPKARIRKNMALHPWAYEVIVQYSETHIAFLWRDSLSDARNIASQFAEKVILE